MRFPYVIADSNESAFNLIKPALSELEYVGNIELTITEKGELK